MESPYNSGGEDERSDDGFFVHNRNPRPPVIGEELVNYVLRHRQQELQRGQNGNGGGGSVLGKSLIYTFL